MFLRCRQKATDGKESVGAKTVVLIDVSEGGSKRERARRVEITLRADLTTSDNHTFQVSVRDISAEGFRIDLPFGEDLLLGEMIELTIRGKEHYKGEVRWTAGREVGLRFIT